MASEAGPGEASAPPECSENLREPAGGLLVGEPLEPPGVQFPESCSVGAVEQVTAIEEPREEPTQEVVVIWVVGLQEIEVLEVREAPDIGEEMVVVEGDVMEVVEVVEEEEVQEQVQAQGQMQESPEEWQERGQAQPGFDNMRSRTSLEALQILQLELSTRLKPLLDRRSGIIRGIPGFWVKTILNHPQMSAMISDQDVDILNYLINLEVEELSHPMNSCKITFFLWRNPYFQNEVITKVFDVTITGYWESHSTPVQWFRDREQEAYNAVATTLALFSDHNLAMSNRIAEVICEDLWLNPLQYYPRTEDTGRGNREADR
ncbi:testis-specific Y-encoded protein 3-like [Choloepus didactylus]|uniref:testis-specific Y-encoded protein 3-like n=1 Tax=Choloepus didactylus TaxID=27675 RepID=UPI00189F0DF4|nr:testis-specific Y-encoded protein 3-like [Choloepus didactylus]